VVTDGIESALNQARAVAGDRVISVGAANVARQFLEAGMLDEIRLSVVSVLLGGGVRLLDGVPVDLERIRAVESDGVTHLWFRVLENVG
jgi:dihydrofolate reductase